MLTPAELLTRTAAVLSSIDAMVDPWHTAAQAPYTLSYSFVTSQPPTVSTIYPTWTPFSATQMDAVRAALAQYAAVINVKFVETTGVNADIVFGRVDLPSTLAGLGSYQYNYSYSGTTVTSQTWKGSALYDVAESLTGVNGTSLLLHEIGHVFGLKHTGNYDAAGGGAPPPYLPAAEENNKYSVMSYNNNPTNNSQSNNLMVYDIAALQQRWGANTTSHTGNDLYSAPAGGVIQAIWDAGGTDAIDGSAQATAVKIDLQQGNFSSVGATDNFVIAYGTVIENAYGGSAADTLIGNASANLLIGNGGSDTLTGGGGADSFVFLRASDSQAGASDYITDFTRGSDHIDLTGMVPTSVAVVQSGGLSVVFATSAGGSLQVAATGDVEGPDLLIGSIGVVIQGDSGSTTLIGTAGKDTLFGQDGNDILSGGSGADVLFGGLGFDTFRYAAAGESVAGGADLIADFQQGIDKLDLSAVAPSAISVIQAGGNSLVFVNTPGGAMQIGALGSIEGSDVTTGGIGVVIQGGAASTIITGSAANDTLFGEAGDDVLVGGLGVDVLFGGTGFDTFRYLSASESTAAARDLIADFQTGIDKIDLRGTGITGIGIANNIVFGSGPGISMQIGVIGTVTLADIQIGASPAPQALAAADPITTSLDIASPSSLGAHHELFV